MNPHMWPVVAQAYARFAEAADALARTGRALAPEPSDAALAPDLHDEAIPVGRIEQPIPPRRFPPTVTTCSTGEVCGHRHPLAAEHPVSETPATGQGWGI